MERWIFREDEQTKTFPFHVSIRMRVSPVFFFDLISESPSLFTSMIRATGPPIKNYSVTWRSEEGRDNSLNFKRRDRVLSRRRLDVENRKEVNEGLRVERKNLLARTTLINRAINYANYGVASILI